MGEGREGGGLPGSQASTIFLLLYDDLLWRTLLVLHLRMTPAISGRFFCFARHFSFFEIVDCVHGAGGKCWRVTVHTKRADNIPVDPDYILLAEVDLHSPAEDILHHSWREGRHVTVSMVLQSDI